MIIGKDSGKFLKDFFKNGGAQVFLISGGDSDFENLLIQHLICEDRSFCKKCDACQTELQFGVRRYEEGALKIEDAREIQFEASQSGLFGSKIFLIKSGYIAQDAQSTLLKTIEEPYPGTYFIISLASENMLTPALLSRLTIFRKNETGESQVASKFKFALEDAAAISKDREKVEDFFKKFESWLDLKLKDLNIQTASEFSGLLEDYFEIKKRFYEKTYSPKMLLEHLAISKYYLK